MTSETKNRYGSAVVTLPNDTQILITRSFDAPAEAVFTAYTTPAYVRRWWGFEAAEWLVCEIDLRVGGAWRFVLRYNDVEFGFHGVYREVERPTRLVTTEVFEGTPDAHHVNTTTFEEVDGVTTMTVLVQHESQEHRDGDIASGEAGVQVSYDRLEVALRAG